MSVCENYEARISALIDDELSAGERVEVLEHLAKCPDCKAYWEDLLAMRDALRAGEVSVPAGFADGVMARVRGTKQARKTLRFAQWKRFAAVAACCAVVLLGIWTMGPMSATENGMDMAVTNGAPAPEMFAPESPAQEDRMLDGGATEGCSLNDDDAAYRYDAGENVLSGCAALLATESEIAEKWVQDTLGTDWVSGESYELSEEQYAQLFALLEDAGEEFNVFMGEKDSDRYLLLAE